jgi:hypothetical protein
MTQIVRIHIGHTLFNTHRLTLLLRAVSVDGGGWQVVAAQIALQLISTTLGLHKHQCQALHVCMCVCVCVHTLCTNFCVRLVKAPTASGIHLASPT